MAADPVLGTPEGDRLGVLVTLVQDCVARHHPMEQQGLTIEDLEPMVGRRNRVCKMLVANAASH